MRFPTQVSWVEGFPTHYSWGTVRSYKAFVDIIEQYGVPTVASLDHDLAEEHYKEYIMAAQEDRPFCQEAMKEKTGYHALAWLLERCAERLVERPVIWIHTMNGPARELMQNLIKEFDTAHPELIPSGI